MILSQHAREFYTLAIVTDPPVTAWEASFDGGRTWHAGQAVGGDTRWLLRGPAVPDDPGRPAVPVTRSVQPLVRGIDEPEVLIRVAPYIILT